MEVTPGVQLLGDSKKIEGNGSEVTTALQEAPRLHPVEQTPWTPWTPSTPPSQPRRTSSQLSSTRSWHRSKQRSSASSQPSSR
eukprot:6905063-Pyramimonas_sp.AAC.1